jgi:hypothetical protein
LPLPYLHGLAGGDWFIAPTYGSSKEVSSTIRLTINGPIGFIADSC